MPDSWENISTHVNGQTCSYSLGEQFILFNYVDFSFFLFFFLNCRHIEVFSTWVWSSFSEDLSHVGFFFSSWFRLFCRISWASIKKHTVYSKCFKWEQFNKKTRIKRTSQRCLRHCNTFEHWEDIAIPGHEGMKRRDSVTGSPRRDGTIENDLPQTSSGKRNNQHFSSSPSYLAYTSTIHPQLIELNWKPSTTITTITNLAMGSTEASFHGYRVGWRKAGRNLGDPWGITSSFALSSLLNQLLIMNSLHLALSSSHWLLISKQGVLACLGWNKNIPPTA